MGPKDPEVKFSFAMLRKLLTYSSQRSYGIGERVFRENDEAHSLHLIRRGTVRVYKSFFGSSKTLMYRSRGSLLGEVAVFDNQARSTSAEAITPVKTLELDRYSFLEEVETNASLAVAFARFLCQRIRQVEQDFLEEFVQCGMELDLAGARLEAKVRERTQDLMHQATRDALTGCLNRRALEGTLDDWARQSEVRFSLMLFDVDYFKSYNDTHGHPAGDDALRTVVEVLQKNLRSDDVLARYGGEEFAILLHGVRGQRAAAVAERLRAAVDDHYFPGQERQPHRGFTISAGLVCFPEEARDPKKLMALADERLYQAKSQGRNGVVGPEQLRPSQES